MEESLETSLSPRITSLRHDLESGKRGALDAFWREIEEKGAPLFESIEGDHEHVFVTFVWRGGEETRNVVVLGGLAGWENLERQQMQRLLDTNVWYKTYIGDVGLRTTYWLAENDSLEPVTRENWEARQANWQHDPLNPRTFLFPRDEELSGDKDVTVSVLELPEAPPQPYHVRRRNVPMGSIEMFHLRSVILDNERRVWVYTPPGYSRDAEAYGLLVLFDGLAYIDLVPTPIILENLIADKKIPPLVCVLIDSLASEVRNRELPCYQPFVNYMTEELLPWVRYRYRVTNDPARTIVGGSSYGGLAATYAGLRAPETFGNVLSQSGSFWWKPEGEEEHEWLARRYVLSPQLPLRFYLDVGLGERIATPDNGPSQVVVNRHMRNVLQAKGYEVTYAEFQGGHDYICWRGTIVDGLLALTTKSQPGTR